MPLPVIQPADVPDLIPDAPVPEDAHVTLAGIWLVQELLGRGVSVDMVWTDAQTTLLKTTLAAKALALKAGLGGVVTLGESASGGGLKSIKLPGLELSLNTTSTDTHGKAVIAASDWERYALQFLALLLPSAGRRGFVGVSR